MNSWMEPNSVLGGGGAIYVQFYFTIPVLPEILHSLHNIVQHLDGEVYETLY